MAASKRITSQMSERWIHRNPFATETENGDPPMRSAKLLLALSLSALIGAAGCAEELLEVGPENVTKPGTGKWDSSVEAVFVDMEFDGTLFTTSSFNAQQTI